MKELVNISKDLMDMEKQNVINNPHGIPQMTKSRLPTDEENRICVATILELSGKSIEEIQEKKDESLVDIRSIESTESMIESIRSTNSDVNNADLLTEKWYTLMIQVLIPFTFAGLGTIIAGTILGGIEKNPIFQDVDALFILIPSMIGLKGNLDMCLASRLSTKVNKANVEKNETWKLILGNIGLVQIQAIIAASVVSVYALLMSSIMSRVPGYEEIVFVVCCCISTATTSCLFLDFLLTGIIFISPKFKVNPDNVATPLAASVGDVVCLLVLSFVAGQLHTLKSQIWILYVIFGFYAILLPILIYGVCRNKYTKAILKQGWTPVLSAIVISGVGGIIMDQAVKNYRGFTVFQPVVNGVGGNLVSVQASRLSTMLHKSSLPGIFPPHTKLLVWPWTALFDGVFAAKSARILILISIVGHMIFAITADIINNVGTVTVTPEFMFTYLTITTLQVMLLLYIAHIMVHYLWKRKIDPDSSAIPYLTALGDLFGTSFLLVAFAFLRAIGKDYQKSI